MMIRKEKKRYTFASFCFLFLLELYFRRWQWYHTIVLQQSYNKKHDRSLRTIGRDDTHTRTNTRRDGTGRIKWSLWWRIERETNGLLRIIHDCSVVPFPYNYTQSDATTHIYAQKRDGTGRDGLSGCCDGRSNGTVLNPRPPKRMQRIIHTTIVLLLLFLFIFNGTHERNNRTTLGIYKNTNHNTGVSGTSEQQQQQQQRQSFIQ